MLLTFSSGSPTQRKILQYNLSSPLSFIHCRVSCSPLQEDILLECNSRLAPTIFGNSVRNHLFLEPTCTVCKY